MDCLAFPWNTKYGRKYWEYFVNWWTVTLSHSILSVWKKVDNRLSVIILAVIIGLFKLAFPSVVVIIQLQTCFITTERSQQTNECIAMFRGQNKFEGLICDAYWYNFPFDLLWIQKFCLKKICLYTLCCFCPKHCRRRASSVGLWFSVVWHGFIVHWIKVINLLPAIPIVMQLFDDG